MAGRILTDDGGRALDTNGNVVSGAKLKAFLAGTSTAAPLYTTRALSVAHASPVVADANGFFAQMWADEGTLLDIKTYAPADVTFVTPLRTFLNVTPQGGLGVTLSVLGYGTPSTDIGDSLQRAHDALGADGGIITIPPSASYYPCLTTAAFTKPVKIIGGGWRSCEIGSETSGIVCITTTSWFSIEGVEFTLFNDALNTDVAWKQLAASNGHGGSQVLSCRFNGGLYQTWLERANTVRIAGCVYENYYTYGLWAQNGTNSDEGDSFLSDTVFGGGSRAQASAAKLTNSGWYWTNFKINSTNTYGIDIDTGTNGDIGDFSLSNGSIEGYSSAGVRIRGFLLSQTGDTHSSTLIDNLASVAGVQVGQNVTGTGIPAGTKVASVGTTSITITNAATATASVTIAISATVTKTGISNVQMSSTATYGVDIDINATNTTISGGSINSGTSASGTAINIRTGAAGVSIGGGLTIYQILNGIVAPSTNVGLALGDVRFGDDVTNIFSGESGITASSTKGSFKRLDLGRYQANASDATWADCFKWRGQGRATVSVIGVTQGAATTGGARAFEMRFLGTTRATAINEQTLGDDIDVQIATSGSDNVLQIRRNSGVAGGTSVDAYVSLTLEGYPTAVVRSA